MSNASLIEFNVPNMLVVIVIFVAIPVIIGVYVYRDAAWRNMNAGIWTLIALLVPLFAGFIIYLVVRGSYTNLKCPSCEAVVTEQHVACPKCGKELKLTCPNCGFTTEAD